MNNFQSIINIIENISLIIKGGGGASFKVNFKKSVHGIVFRITTNIKEKFFFKRGVGGGGGEEERVLSICFKWFYLENRCCHEITTIIEKEEEEGA